MPTWIIFGLFLAKVSHERLVCKVWYSRSFMREYKVWQICRAARWQPECRENWWRWKKGFQIFWGRWRWVWIGRHSASNVLFGGITPTFVLLSQSEYGIFPFRIIRSTVVLVNVLMSRRSANSLQWFYNNAEDYCSDLVLVSKIGCTGAPRLHKLNGQSFLASSNIYLLLVSDMSDIFIYDFSLILDLQTGSTFAPAKPWQPGTESRIVTEVKELNKTVQQHLELLLNEEEKGTA